MSLRGKYQHFAAWHAGLSTRERRMVTGGVCLVLALLWFAFLFDPLQKRATESARILAEVEATAAANAETYEVALGASSGPEAEAQLAQLRKLREEETVVAEAVRTRLTTMVAPDTMVDLVRDVLVDHPGVKLMGIRNLPVRPLGSALPPPDSDDPDVPGATSFNLHEIEIVVEGDYASLKTYLKALEMVPWSFFWKSLDVTVVDYPRNRAKIVLGTVSDQKPWMRL